MSDRIPGVGALTDVPRAAPNPSFEGLKLNPEDWFLLSRVDGSVTLKEIFALSPKNREETIAILKRLHDAELLELPGVERGGKGASGAAAGEKTGASKAKKLPELPEGWPIPYESFTFDPELLALDVDLDEGLRKFVMYYHGHLEMLNYYQLLGVERGASVKPIRRAYFKLSKTFHPDRFFRQDLGVLGEMISEIFQALNEAQRTLTDAKRREAYDATIASGATRAASSELSGPKPRSGVVKRTRPLSELLGAAKQAEKEGDYQAAFEAYEEALKLRRSPELMNRSAECLIRLRDRLELAEARARGAVKASPETARYWVALAYILELRKQIPKAREAYERALVLDPEHEGARVRLDRLKVG